MLYIYISGKEEEEEDEETREDGRAEGIYVLYQRH